MATRRMISKDVHQRGEFINLTPTSKALYDDMVLYADDDGFCNDITLINLLVQANEKNYQELEKANLIINVGGVYVIADWLNTQLLNHYTRTNLLSVSSKIYIKTDFRYTTNSSDNSIAISLDDWVENKKRNRSINLKKLQQIRLNKTIRQNQATATNTATPAFNGGGKQMVTPGKPSVTDDKQMVTKGSPSIDKYSIDKSSIDEYSSGQHRTDKFSKGVYTATTSSNGGMGENASLSSASTSTVDNNATRENGVITGEDSGVTTSSNETEINYLTEHELGLIINNECPIPVLRKAIIFACITGFRRSDILALKWEDIKELPKGGWCVFKRMQKTKNMANVPIGDDLMEVIGPRGEGLVFNGLTTYMLTYPMKRWFKSIGIKKDLHFHCTRHTYATLSLALGTDIITIKNVLGHKQESTTMRYTKVVNPLKEQAAKRLSINTISQNTEQYEKGNF